jgi:hypothetical protein
MKHEKTFFSLKLGQCLSQLRFIHMREFFHSTFNYEALETTHTSMNKGLDVILP